MKKSLFNLGLLGLAVLTMLSACSKDSTGPDGEGNNNEITVGSGVMALKANNSQVVFEDIAGTIFIPGNAVSAYGTSTNSLSGFALVLNDPDGIRPGSYPIADYNTATGLQKFFTCAYSQIVSLDSALAAVPDTLNPAGSLTITEVDFGNGFISGTFNADLKTREGFLVRLTEGQFNRLPLTSGKR